MKCSDLDETDFMFVIIGESSNSSLETVESLAMSISVACGGVDRTFAFVKRVEAGVWKVEREGVCELQITLFSKVRGRGVPVRSFR